MQDLSQYINPALGIHTVGDVRSIIEGRREGFAYAPKMRVLNRDLTRYALSTPPVAGDTSDVSPWITAATVKWTDSGDVPRSMDMSCTADLLDAVNFENIYLQPFACYYDITGDAPVPLLEIPRGVFMTIQPQRAIADGPVTGSVTMYERTWIVRDCAGFINPYVIPQGFDPVEAAQVMLRMDCLLQSEGGRSPSGSTTTGPQGSIPSGAGSSGGTNQYASGFPTAASVSVGTNADGSLQMPAGCPFAYNPYGGALVDPANHYFPVDPWTCQPMSIPKVNGLPWVGDPDRWQPNAMILVITLNVVRA
jgi:hypothetical protein